ncbi:MAG: GIY-YIG nuclease family protein [Woeseiaceae bacterium]|nr:GIY-YIG nuclease family protein [Woeseiaceae bacterium]
MAAAPDAACGSPDTAQPDGPYYLYILRCADGSLYTGIALDVAGRLRDHDGNRAGAKYLRGRKPFEKVFECPAGDRSRAQHLEHRVKRLTRAEKLRLIGGKFSPEDLLAPQASGSGCG